MPPSFWDVHAQTKRRSEPPAPSQPTPLSVTQVAQRINGALRDGLPAVLHVRGEISQWKAASSGHRYFSLKDAQSCIDAKMWKSAAAALKFEPAEGQEVIATGRVDFWNVRGQLSLVVDAVEPVGQGALELAFRQLVEKLRREGLFDPGRKQAIPPYPQRIALLSSSQAAGYIDVLKVLRPLRFLELFLLPIPVQGAGAAEQIAGEIRLLSARHGDVGGVDVALLVRGGGSVEDLWAFNEEIVARAMANCRVPIVSGIGHEVDTTIADLVADLRAHTPTEAAQQVVRHWKNAPDRVGQLQVRLNREMRDLVRHGRTQLQALERHEVLRRPGDIVDRRRQLVDEQTRRLTEGVRERLRRARDGVRMAELRLSRLHPAARLSVQQQQLRRLHDRLRSAAEGRLPGLRGNLTQLEWRLTRSMPQQTATVQARLAGLTAMLEALNPKGVLGRGYTLTRLERTGQLLRDPHQVRPGDRLVTETARGPVSSTVGRESQPELFPADPAKPDATPD